MVDTRALKKKGVPPPRQTAEPTVIHADPRPDDGKNKPLQFMVPPRVADEFSAEAGAVFGFNKGAKSKLFLALWEAYKANKS